MRRSVHGLIMLGLCTALLAGCSGDDGGSDESPEDALAEAQRVLDEASSVAVTLTGDDLPDGGTVVIGAEGVAQRPASFEGTVDVRLAGITAGVDVVSIDGTVWAKLPLTRSFAEIDPGDIGVSDPGALLAAETGLSRLLTAGTDVQQGDEVRVEGEVLQEYTATLPASEVEPLLPLSDDSADVEATFAIAPESGELRRAVLTGPFYEGGDQTYTVVLDDYGADVDIRPPD